MKIGIIGVGIVGGTILKAYETLGFDVVGYDPFKDEYKDNQQKVTETNIVFVCLPTIELEDGEMDMSPFENIIPMLNRREYKGLIIIKSTILPGTTNKYCSRFPKLSIVHSPEFLTEKNAMIDFFRPDRIVLGLPKKVIDKELLTYFNRSHKIFNAPIVVVDVNTSEFMKFMSNSFLATKVSFANEMNEIAQIYGANYDKAKEILYMDRRVGEDHLGINKERGYRGMCLPKDINQLLVDLKNKKRIPSILSNVKKVNERDKKLEWLE